MRTVKRAVYSESEVAQMLGVHRTTVASQAARSGTPLSKCVIWVTPSKRVYPVHAIHALIGIPNETAA